MKIILFCHPAFLSSQSMPRFARMLQQAYLARGYEVAIWSPKEVFHRWFKWGVIGKWAGYIDQYIMFPHWVENTLRRQSSTPTLYVFCDQALGPWVPLVAKRAHVIHCHDFLALESAMGEYPQNPVSLTGRMYQRYIRRGFRKGRYFISVSHKSKQELTRFLVDTPVLSEVVHNGLNYKFEPMPEPIALNALRNVPVAINEQKMLVHVGGNTWYKNRLGVVHIYAQYCQQCDTPLPLWMVGEAPSANLRLFAKSVPPNGKVYFLSGLTDQQVQAIYSLAKVLIFPSLAEGFGWPIAEAMACGCPVLTTNQAPMTEVGGTAATYIPVMPITVDDIESWAASAAKTLIELLNVSAEQKILNKNEGIEQVSLFDADKAITAYEKIYHQVMTQFRHLN